jgi:phosphoenolpyruvate synthase/pyruvate phosphate dikinase
MIKKRLKILKMKALPFQETGAFSQHRFLESLRFPQLHSETQIVNIGMKEEAERERESSTEGMSVMMIIFIFFEEE